MLYQEFELPKYKWKIYAFYDTTSDDLESVMDCLYNLKCPSELAKKAYRNISDNKPNTGLTFSKNKKTCIVLGRATDCENFSHTYVHEIFHCAIHIANEYGISTQGEEIAYLAGDIGSLMLPYASPFFCKHCNKGGKYV